MKRRIITGAGLALAAAACSDSPTDPTDPAFATGVEPVAICHIEEETGLWELLMVSPLGKSVQKHLAHGDGLPGGDVPGMAGYAFDDACIPMATEPKVFAVAYVDRDANDGGYQEGFDHLIAMLVDANRDGEISVGDEIVRGGYPLDFGASAMGAFGGTSSTVMFVYPPTASDVIVLTGDTNGVWFNHTAGREYYFEETMDEVTDLFIRDDLTNALVESIQAVLNGGLSMPQTGVFEVREALPTDDAYLDVEIDLDGF